jgi:hypothetical protein
MRKSWCNLRGATTLCVSEQRVSRGSRYCRRPAHPTRSPKTSVGSAPAGAPLVPSCRAPVYGRRACGLSAAPRDRAGTVSCGSARCLPAATGCAGVDSRTVAAPEPVPATSGGSAHRPAAARHSGKSSAAARPTRRLDSVSNVGPPRNAMKHRREYRWRFRFSGHTADYGLRSAIVTRRSVGAATVRMTKGIYSIECLKLPLIGLLMKSMAKAYRM